eukprot:TRINITY_DN8816_c0_g1_i1.p1 TRINITY_DN8816_c0_g1~~TRINITY_DN8816_c0_g1_i1.p1  ORF type:complete len:391 (-),score=45.84 TRINITY_DN8816_c0_g1_i1:122-1294(-)
MFWMILSVPVGIMILCASLLATCVQIVLSVLVFPISPYTYRVVNAYMMLSFWSMFVWLVEWWGRVELRVYGDPKDWAYFGKESALCICNHRSDIDWAIGWVFSQRAGCIGGTRALIKEEAKWVPVVGWSMWFSEYLFLARNYAKDQTTIKDGYERLRHFPLFFWVALFVEGTRFTEEKLKVAQEFAKEAGIPVPRNTLVPRTKGFVMSVQELRGHAPAVYDFTVNYPKGMPRPTFSNILKRKHSQIDVHLRRVPMEDIPNDSEEAAKWCRDVFVKKDDILDVYIKFNGFDEKERLPTTKSPLTIVHTCIWTSLVLAAGYFLVGPALASITLSWATLGWSLIGLVATLVVLRFLVKFTQSEHGTPASRLSKKNKTNGAAAAPKEADSAKAE